MDIEAFYATVEQQAAYFEYDGVFRRRADDLHGLQVRVRERLGPGALAPDDEQREEVGEPEQRQHQFGVGPRRVRHRGALQVARFDPSAEVVQPLHGL